MKQPATIQRIVAEPSVHSEHLVLEGEVFVWTADESRPAFVFEDFLFDPECPEREKCTRHAECVSRVLGGLVIRTSVRMAREEAHPPIARASARPTRHRWDHVPTPTEAYEEMERRGLE